MKKLYSFLNNTGIKTKLLFSYVCVVFIPVLIVGIILTVNLRERMIESAIKEAEWNLERVRRRFSDITDICIQISDIFFSDEIFRNVIARDFQDTYEVYLTYLEQPRFDQYRNLYNEIDDLRVYINNPTALEN